MSEKMSTIIQYLLGVIKADEVSNMSRLASLTVLNKLFNSDNDMEIQSNCLKKGLISSLTSALDVGLSSKCDPSDIVFVCVVMETLGRLSRLPSHMMQPLLSVVVIRRLLMYIDVQGDFFVYPPKLMQVIRATLENKQLVGKVKTIRMAPEPIEYIHRHTKNKLKRLSKLPSSLKACSLFHTSQGTDVDLAKDFLHQGLAWSGSNIPGDVIGEPSEDWQDILVTKVIDGTFFWAQVGEETLKEVCLLQQQLNNGTQLERHLVSSSGDLVIVRAELQGTTSLFRAQVVSVNGLACMVDAFLVDYGHMVTVPDGEVFKMQDFFKAIPKKVSLCKLDGLQPVPKDEDLCGNAAAVLTNIVKQGFPHVGELICQLHGMAIIERFIKSTNKASLITSILTLLGNMGHTKKLCGEFVESDVIPVLLGKLSDEEVPANDEDKTVFHNSCIECLVNILHRNPVCREKFYQCQGLDIVLQFLWKHVRVNSSLYISTLKLLKVFVGQAVIEKNTATRKQSPGSKQNNDKVSESKNNDDAECQNKVRSKCVLSVGEECKGNSRSPQKSPGISSRRSDGSVSPIRLSETNKVSKDVNLDDEIIPDNDGLVPQFSEAHETETNNCYVPCSEPCVTETSSGYVLGDCVYISDDQKNELHPATKASNISETSLLQIICGMLNAGRRGTIYCGIGKDGIVFGLKMSRDDKDMFRIGIDHIVHRKLNPNLVHTNFEFKAIPVLQKGTCEAIPDLFVIEIHVKAARGVTYTANDDECFYRYGSTTTRITKQEIRHLVVLEEEEQLCTEIERLLERKKLLLQKP